MIAVLAAQKMFKRVSDGDDGLEWENVKLDSSGLVFRIAAVGELVWFRRSFSSAFPALKRILQRLCRCNLQVFSV